MKRGYTGGAIGLGSAYERKRLWKEGTVETGPGHLFETNCLISQGRLSTAWQREARRTSDDTLLAGDGTPSLSHPKRRERRAS
jgi:hypothetical protein